MIQFKLFISVKLHKIEQFYEYTSSGVLLTQYSFKISYIISR